MDNKNEIGEVKVSVILPALNEAENLRLLLPRLARVRQVDEVLLVDGHSTDGTVEVAKSLMPDIVLVKQTGKGRGEAVREGAALARGEYLVTLDADGSQRPEEIPMLLAKAEEGYEIVKASRHLQDGGTADETWDTRLMVWLTQFVTNFLWGTNYSDTVYGLCLIRRETFHKLSLKARRNCLEHEMMGEATRYGMRVAEVPSFEDKRLYGHVKFSYLKDGLAIGCTVFREAFKIWRDRLVRKRLPMKKPARTRQFMVNMSNRKQPLRPGKRE